MDASLFLPAAFLVALSARSALGSASSTFSFGRTIRTRVTSVAGAGLAGSGAATGYTGNMKCIPSGVAAAVTTVNAGGVATVPPNLL